MRLNLKKLETLRNNISFLKRLEESINASEADRLLRRVGRVNRVNFLTGEETLTTPAKKRIAGVLKTRARGIPLSYILGEAYFLGDLFYVTKETLIPRPETELLAEEAIKVMTAGRPQFFGPEILDIGTGCGCLAVSLTIRRPDCRMTALDISSAALRVARNNIKRHALEQKIRLVKSDLFDRVRGGVWDVIISNPPYIPACELADLPKEVLREPKLALDGGERGLSVIKKILAQAPTHLKKGGWLLMEIGKGQSDLLRRRIGKDVRYTGLRFIKDLAGVERILVVRKNG